jgi:hypothetical protein
VSRGGLTPIPQIRVEQNADGHGLLIESSGSATAGIWGGTTEIERTTVSELSTDEATELFERTLSERIERRIAAFERNRAAGIKSRTGTPRRYSTEETDHGRPSPGRTRPSASASRIAGISIRSGAHARRCAEGRLAPSAQPPAPPPQNTYLARYESNAEFQVHHPDAICLLVARRPETPGARGSVHPLDRTSFRYRERLFAAKSDASRYTASASRMLASRRSVSSMADTRHVRVEYTLFRR